MKNSLKFNGVDDRVKAFYCPICDDYTIIQVGENHFKCVKCGVEVQWRGYLLHWNRALKDEEVERLLQKARM
jgi:ribosomal protein L37AE/L43A